MGGDSWQYQKGDLLYGLSGPRERLKKHLKVPEGPWTIDDYRLSQEPGSLGEQFGSHYFDAGFIHAMRFNYEEQRDKAEQTLSHNDRDASAVNRRKSKFGLEWITRHTERRIHFCLDEIDMEKVVEKSYSNDDVRDFPPGKAQGVSWDDKERSITGAELRWVYRNRADLRVVNRIQFWQNNRPVAPPWADKDGKALWSRYLPTNTW